MVLLLSMNFLLRILVKCSFSIYCIVFQRSSVKDMETKNITELTAFILTGLAHQPEWQIPLFLLFLMIYLITIVGNLGLIVLICNDPHLHIPMYLFLGSLAFVDAWVSSTVTPKMLVNFLGKSRMISLSLNAWYNSFPLSSV